MELSDYEIEEFRELWLEEFGEEISADEARGLVAIRPTSLLLRGARVGRGSGVRTVESCEDPPGTTSPGGGLFVVDLEK